MKIIFSDIDGTFIENGKIPPENIEAVDALINAGHRFVFISGRGIGQVEEILEKAGIDCDYIYGNGAGYRIIGEEPVLKYYIDKSEYTQWEQVMEENNGFYCMHTTEGILMKPLENLENDFARLRAEYFKIYGEEMALYLDKKKVDYYGTKAIFAKNPFDYLRSNPEVKLIKFELLNGEQDVRENIQKLALEFNYLAFSSVRINLEIVPALSNKGDAIKNYLATFDNIEKTYGFGDALNDLAMFETVDVSISMGNATNEVKDVCDVVLDEEMGSYILRELI